MKVIKLDGKELQLGRIFGGIAWPGEKPGFAVLVGEEFYPAMVSRKYHCHLLAEIEEITTNNLIRQCVELAGQFRIDSFYGRYDPSNMRYLSLWNRDARERRLPDFNIYPASFSDDGSIEFHLNILKDRLSAEHKTLHLFGQSKLPGYLLDIPPNKIKTATDSQFPAVAALGYAVSMLTQYPPQIEKDEEIDFLVDRDPTTGY